MTQDELSKGIDDLHLQEELDAIAEKAKLTLIVDTYVYFISDGNSVKIGFSKCVRHRVRALQTCNANILTVLRVYKGDKFLEEKFHKSLSEYRVNGEWFTISKKVLQTFFKEYDSILEVVEAHDDFSFKNEQRWTIKFIDKKPVGFLA